MSIQVGGGIECSQAQHLLFLKEKIVLDPPPLLQMCNMKKTASNQYLLRFDCDSRAAELMTQTGDVVTLRVAKQGAIYHGLATLLSEPSPVTQRRKLKILFSFLCLKVPKILNILTAFCFWMQFGLNTSVHNLLNAINLQIPRDEQSNS